MLAKEFDIFLNQQIVKKRILKIVSSISFLVILILLFAKDLPLPFQRSWLIVPAVLVIVFCVLGILRIKKRIHFFSSVVKGSQVGQGQLTVTNPQMLINGMDFLAEVRIGNQNWELHVFPPLFTSEEPVSELQNVEVLLDHEKRPAILKTTLGWLFISSARTGR